jgi:hypothetical protein
MVRRVRVPEPHRTWIQLAMVMVAIPIVQAFGLDYHFTAGMIAIPVVLRLANQGAIAAGWLFAMGVACVLVIASDPLLWKLWHSPPSAAWVRQPLIVPAASLLLYAIALGLIGLGIGIGRLNRPQPVR